MKATIIAQPTTEPPPVTIQITASPLQFAVLAEVLGRCVRWKDLPGGFDAWAELNSALVSASGDFGLHATAIKTVSAAGGQYHP